MYTIFLCSGVLIITPIIFVQYQRYLAFTRPLGTYSHPHDHLEVRRNERSGGPQNGPQADHPNDRPSGNSRQRNNPDTSLGSRLYSLLEIGPQTRLIEPSTSLPDPRKRRTASLDGADSEPSSETLSDPRPARGKTTSGGFQRRESRKPWDPPFPTTMTRKPYLVLSPTEEREESEDKEDERLTTASQLERANEGYSMVHLPVTDLPQSAPIHHQKSEPRHDISPGVESEAATPQPTPEPAKSASVKAEESNSLSWLQAIALILTLIIFIFAFAILVAHCMAWFVVYKTEARLGDVRKGLLRGGDMRVCLCAR